VFFLIMDCLQCFDTVGWASGRASGREKLSDEVLVCNNNNGDGGCGR